MVMVDFEKSAGDYWNTGLIDRYIVPCCRLFEVAGALAECQYETVHARHSLLALALADDISAYDYAETIPRINEFFLLS